MLWVYIYCGLTLTTVNAKATHHKCFTAYHQLNNQISFSEHQLPSVEEKAEIDLSKLLVSAAPSLQIGWHDEGGLCLRGLGAGSCGPWFRALAPGSHTGSVLTMPALEPIRPSTKRSAVLAPRGSRSIKAANSAATCTQAPSAVRNVLRKPSAEYSVAASATT